MTSCSEWTGVPLSLLLKEAGVQSGASWIVAEGAEEVKGASSIPLAKAMDDCLVATARMASRASSAGLPAAADGSRLRRNLSDQVSAADQSGGPLLHDLQRLRAHQSGSESGRAGRIRLARNRSSRFRPEDSSCPAPASTRSAAWRGPAAARFAGWRYPPTAARAGRTPSCGRRPIQWRIPGSASTGNGTAKSACCMSRCTDELGTVQPTRAEIAKYFNKPLDANFRVPGADNTIQPWRVASDGSVHNGLA